MKNRTDLQELLPESHRDLVEAVPRDLMKSLFFNSFLMGAFMGGAVTYMVPQWMAGYLVGALLLGHFLYRWWSEKDLNKRMAELDARGLDWKTDEPS